MKGEYDITKVVESLKEELYSQVRPFLGVSDLAIAKRKIRKALNAYYPPFENADWDKVLHTVVNVHEADK